MIEVNIDQLGDEKLKFFQDKFIDMFSRIKEETDLKLSGIKIPESQKTEIKDEKMSPGRKIAVIATKILKNTAISMATGLDPVDLDHDIQLSRKSEAEKVRYYQKCNMKKLAYSVTKEFSDALQEMLNMLRSNDKQVFMKCMNEIDHNYKIMWNIKIETEHPNYEALWHSSFEILNIFKGDERLRWRALLYNGIGLFLTINPIEELNKIYQEYINTYGGKTEEDSQAE